MKLKSDIVEVVVGWKNEKQRKWGFGSAVMMGHCLKSRFGREKNNET